MRLRSPVERVAWTDPGVRLRAAGAEVEADCAVVAVPASVLGRIAFDPPLPAPLAEALAGVRYGHAAKLFVPLADAAAPPSAVMSVPERYWCWTATGPGPGIQPVVSSFAGSPAALAALEVERGPERWLASLARLRTDLALEPDGALLSTWSDDPWAGAAYSTSPPPELAELCARRGPARLRRRARRRRVRRADGGGDSQRTPRRPRARRSIRPSGLAVRMERTDLGRIVAFTDGVMAVAITLLVLNIEVPEVSDGSRLGDELVDLFPSLLSYALSFALVGRFWVIHHNAFETLRAFDGRLMTLNLIFLALIALMPFATDLFDRYSDEPLAAAVFGAILGLAALVNWLMHRHSIRAGFVKEEHMAAHLLRHRRRAGLHGDLPALGPGRLRKHVPGGGALGLDDGPALPAAQAGRHQLRVDLRHLARHVGPVEAEHVLRGLGHEPVAQLGVGQQALGHRRERARGRASGSAGRRRSFGTTSRRPPVSATRQGQPDAIASSATRPNGS